jgi:hypothetical protein
MLIASSVVPFTTQTVVSDAGDGNALATAEITAGILSYTHWPAVTNPVRLCMVGASSNTSRIGNRRLVNGRQLIVSRTAVADADASHCDAVHIGRVSATERANIQRAIIGQPIVSMTDNDPQCLSGAMFCLRNAAGGGITFDLNIDAVSRSRVRVDPRVLALARRQEAGR